MNEILHFEDGDRLILRNGLPNLIVFDYYIKEPDLSYGSIDKYKSECDSIVIFNGDILYLEFLPKSCDYDYKYLVYTFFNKKKYRYYIIYDKYLENCFTVDKIYRRSRKIDKLLSI